MNSASVTSQGEQMKALQRRAFAFAAAATIAASTAVMSAGPAAAATFICDGIHDALTVGDVHVPDGGRCYLRTSTVQGNVTTGSNAFLLIHRSTVYGSVQATRSTVQITESRIGGQVVIDQPIAVPQSQGPNAPIVISCGNVIDGSFIVRGAPSPTGGGFNIGGRCESHLGGSRIGGNLVLTNNIVNPAFGIALSNNTVGGYLYCVGNSPPPLGASNTAAQKLGQCAAL